MNNHSIQAFRSDEEMVAYALEIQPQLLPFVPELLADLDELGSDAEVIVEIIRELNLASSAHVVDLGCGKGAVSFEIADELGLRVTGVDLFEPFVVECRKEAERADLSDLCHFVFGNIQQLSGEIETGDVVILAALGDVLGSPAQTMGIIRNYVRSGGYVIISDGYLKDNTIVRFAGFENYQTRAKTMEALCSFGDILIKEITESTDSSDETETETETESNLILARAITLAEKHPELADAFLEFAQSQRAEYEFLDQHFIDTIWVLQRN